VQAWTVPVGNLSIFHSIALASQVAEPCNGPTINNANGLEASGGVSGARTTNPSAGISVSFSLLLFLF